MTLSRSRSRTESGVKGTLPHEIVPHLHFELVEPPLGSTSDQLRQIPYQVVTAPSLGRPNHADVTPTSSAAIQDTAAAAAAVAAAAAAAAESRKRHRLYPGAVV